MTRNPGALVEAAASAPGPVLVVGHSNTVHDLVGRFGGTPPAPLSEEDYGTIFVVEPDGEVATLEVR
jgi:broad specificity phosphatase PhoE